MIVQRPWGMGKFVSIAFIECQEFIELDKARRQSILDTLECCSDCHRHGRLLYVQPYLEDQNNPDWTLCIEALVCCNLYHFVRDLPREWWVKRSMELNVYRMDQRGYVYPHSPDKNLGERRERVNVQASVKGRESKKKSKDEPEFSFEDFLKGRTD
jgi:hypothetical protein